MAGRPRGFDSGEVLDAALDLFWSGGYEATTTRDLAVRVGLTQSSLYNAFGSKQELLNAAMDRYEAQVASSLIGPLEESETGLAALEDFVRGLGKWLAKGGGRGCLLINMMAEDGGATREVAERTRAYRRRLRRAFRRALQSAEDQGESELDLADARADLLIGLVLGLNIAARGGAGPTELQRLVAGSVTQVRAWRVS